MATATAPRIPQPRTRTRSAARKASRTSRASGAVLAPWLRAQSINVTRHAAALRPFRRAEFGAGAAAPSEGHLQAVNQLITKLRKRLLKVSSNVGKSLAVAQAEPDSKSLERSMIRKDRAHNWVRGIE